MKFKLNKILSAFGNTPSLEPTHDDNYIKDIIKSVDEEAFAVSEQNVLFAKVSELGCYYYVITIVVGRLKIKTKNGGNLSIEGKKFNLILNSDMDEFESNHSNVSNSFITRIDFQIEKEDVSKFDKKSITSLKLSAKKQEVIFTTL